MKHRHHTFRGGGQNAAQLLQSNVPGYHAIYLQSAFKCLEFDKSSQKTQQLIPQAKIRFQHSTVFSYFDVLASHVTWVFRFYARFYFYSFTFKYKCCTFYSTTCL